MNKQICAIALILLSTAACATTTAPRPQFPDVQLPAGLTYQPDRSVVIESPSVKAAQLVYRGRLEPQSLRGARRARSANAERRHVHRSREALLHESVFLVGLTIPVALPACTLSTDAGGAPAGSPDR